MPKGEKEKDKKKILKRFDPLKGRNDHKRKNYFDDRYRRAANALFKNDDYWREKYPHTFKLLYPLPRDIQLKNKLRIHLQVRNKAKSHIKQLKNCSWHDGKWPGRVEVLQEVLIQVVDGFLTGHIDSSKVAKDDNFSKEEKKYIIRTLIPFIQAFTEDKAYNEAKTQALTRMIQELSDDDEEEE